MNSNTVDNGCSDKTVLLKEEEEKEQEKTLDTITATSSCNDNDERIEQPKASMLFRRFTT